MRRIIIASHGLFSAGLKNTLEFIAGVNDVIDINAYMDADIKLEDQVIDIFSSFKSNDEVLVMTDILQGSVNQAFQPYLNDKVFLVTGINVPCALELCLMPGPLTKDSIRDTIQNARKTILFVNDYEISFDENDE